MIPYKQDQLFGITFYEYDADSITLQYDKGDIYVFSIKRNSTWIINKMISHAQSDIGLNTFVAKNKPKYDTKNGKLYQILEQDSAHNRFNF